MNHGREETLDCMLTAIKPNGKCSDENLNVSEEVWTTNLGRAPD